MICEKSHCECDTLGASGHVVIDLVGNMQTEYFKSTKPSVVMIVMGYNQQDSIGYAIDSALLQDYDGSMTIVLSDDCSSDGTYDVMRKKAEVYQRGFYLILNRNESNLGYS